VTDWEEAINLREGDVYILDAEVYAHEYAMLQMLDGDYRVALSYYLDQLEMFHRGTGYQKTVSDRILGTELFKQCKQCSEEQWSDHLAVEGLTEAEAAEAAQWASALSKLKF